MTMARYNIFSLFFFNDTATTEIYTLSLHDALPICRRETQGRLRHGRRRPPRPYSLEHLPEDLSIRGRAPNAHAGKAGTARRGCGSGRSEEHTSELQSRLHLVCRLLLEKKKSD